MKKLRGSRGVTLTETLCTVLIVLLISAMLAVGVRFAVRTYRESMELSETELLCSTLTAAISDKLRYSGEVGQNMFIQGVGTTDSGGGGSFAISDDGEVVIQTTDSEEFRLLGSASYPQGLRVRTTGTGETGFISYSAETGIFTEIVDERRGRIVGDQRYAEAARLLDRCGGRILAIDGNGKLCREAAGHLME